MALVKKNQKLQKRPIEIPMNRAEYSDLVPGVLAEIEHWDDLMNSNDSIMEKWIVINEDLTNKFWPRAHPTGDVLVRYEEHSSSHLVWYDKRVFKYNFPIHELSYTKYEIKKLFKTPNIDFQSKEELAEYLKKL